MKMLNSGYPMPILGLGTWTLRNEVAENSVYTALKDGYRLIDTARYYANESEVGKAIQRAIEEGICSREEIFITTKIMPGDARRAKEAIEESLKDLQVDYIDLLLIHQPGSNDEEVYKAMEDAVHEGKVHSIGISNYYTKEAVEEVLGYATITPAVIQNENHIYYQNTELMNYVKENGIVLESWYPFGGRGNTKENFEHPTIVELAEKYHKTAAQIILRWHIQAGYIVIPGSSNAEHIKENAEIFDFELTDEDMEKIHSIDMQKRYENW
ncbi:MAG: aldo/keto reductase [Solobacterium sp.]|nr:aldo/keto reductase [Solobacterium sp.]